MPMTMTDAIEPPPGKASVWAKPEGPTVPQAFFADFVTAPGDESELAA